MAQPFENESYDVGDNVGDNEDEEFDDSGYVPPLLCATGCGTPVDHVGDSECWDCGAAEIIRMHRARRQGGFF